MNSLNDWFRFLPRYLAPVMITVSALRAAPGPGIIQPTWNTTQIGTEVFHFENTAVGTQPTMMDYQHGYLYIGSAPSVDLTIPGRISWYDLSNPRSPVPVTQIEVTGNKPHMAAFWEDRMIDGFQASSFRIWDFDDMTVAGTFSGSVSPVYYMLQAPYVYRPRNGYSFGSNRMEIAKLNNTGATSIALFDLSTVIGFPVGSLHAVGNLLICSASQTAGVATLDISDPANPKLLDQLITGNSVYTSMVHGTRIYQCEQNLGIRVYDFANPSDIKLVGYIDTPDNPRYVTLKDGIGYCVPGSAKLIKFDATTLKMTKTWTLPGSSDAIQTLGNMALIGGSGEKNRCSIVPVETAPDTTGPSVGFSSLSAASQNLAVTSRIGFIMSEPIDVTSLNTSTFIVRPVGGEAIAGTYSTQMGMINFSPTDPLSTNTTYEVLLPIGGVRDAVGNASTTPYSATFTTDGSTGTSVLAHWRLNNTSTDTSGSGYNLTRFNGPYFTTDFKEGSHSLLFDGLNDYADAGVVDVGNHFSFSAWVKIASTRTNSQTIASNSSSGSNTNGFRLFVNSSGSSDGKIIFETGNGSDSASASTATGTFVFNQWNHIVVSVDRSAGLARIYCNGVHATTNSSVRTDFATSGNLNLGRMANGFYLGGQLDDMRIHRSGLTGTQVQNLFLSNQLARWSFDGSTEDSSGNKLIATLVNAAAYNTDRAEGSHSLLLNGGTAYATAPAAPLDTATISAWVKVDSGASDIQTIIANGSSGTGTGIKLYVNSSLTNDAKIVVESANGTTSTSFRTASGVFAKNVWNHVALVVNRTAGTGSIYYNGVLSSSGSILTDYAISAPLTIGAYSGGTFTLKGSIDDVRIYDRGLNATEVTTLADAGNNSPVITTLSAPSQQSLVGANVTFTASATDPDLSDTLLYSFNFGDGSPATPFSASNTATHAFAAPGRYIVNVRATDGVTQVSRQSLFISHYPLTATKPTASTQILQDAARGKVWCVNPDSNTISRMDEATLLKDLEVATGTHPRSIALRPDGTALWVVCEKSDEIRIYNPVNGAQTGTITLDYGSAPVAVAFAPNGSAVFIAMQGRQRLMKFNPATLAPSGSLSLPGQPFSISVSGDSSRLLVTRFISPDTRGEVWDVSASSLTLTRTLPLAFDTAPDSENSGSGVPNYLQHAVITPDGRRAFVPSKKDNIGRGTLLNGQALTHDNTVRSIISQIDLIGNTELLSARRDADNHSLNGAVCYSPLGDLAFVAYQSNNEVRVVDTATGAPLTSAETGFAPQFLCLSNDGTKLYVMNFLSRSISTFNAAPVIAGTSSVLAPIGNPTAMVSNELLSGTVLTGKRIFYNASDQRMSAEGYISCASCHLDGGHDGRTWDFTDRGEGLRNTTTLLGRAGMAHGRVHWSGNFDEIQDFEHDMRGPFAGTGFLSNSEFITGTRNQTLGTPKAGVNAELDALAAYVSSLNEHPRSPARQANGQQSTASQNGRNHFISLSCFECHSGEEFTDSPSNLLHDIGTLKPSSGMRLGATLLGIDTPTLRGLNGTAPYLHDGSAATLADVFKVANAPDNTQHAAYRNLNTTQQAELLAYLRELDTETPGANGNPHITSLSPDTGLTSGGTTVTITGLNLTGTTSVTFNGSAATHVTVLSNTSVTCVTPARPDGEAHVVLTTAAGLAGKAAAYTYTEPTNYTVHFNAWASSVGGITFTGDANQDGVADGLAWLFGASGPSVNANALMPSSSLAGNGSLTLNFNSLKPTARGTAILKLQYSRDLGITDPWASHTITVPDSSGDMGGVQFTITSINGTDLNQVQATVPASAAGTGGKVFVRLFGDATSP